MSDDRPLVPSRPFLVRSVALGIRGIRRQSTPPLICLAPLYQILRDCLFCVPRVWNALFTSMQLKGSGIRAEHKECVATDKEAGFRCQRAIGHSVGLSR